MVKISELSKTTQEFIKEFEKLGFEFKKNADLPYRDEILNYLVLQELRRLKMITHHVSAELKELINKR